MVDRGWQLRLVLAAAILSGVACNGGNDNTGSGLVIDGRTYWATCAPVDDSLLADELGRHEFQLETVRVRAVAGVEESDAIAVHHPDGCYLEDIKWALWPSDLDRVDSSNWTDDARQVMDPVKLEQVVKYEACIESAQGAFEEDACG